MLDPVPHERRRAQFGLAYVDPWADRRLVEFVLATPAWRVQRPGEPKRLARLALADLVGIDIARSLGKTEPADLYDLGWRDRARATIWSLLTHMRSAQLGYVDETALRAAYQAQLDGRHGRYDLWWALSLEVWLRAQHDRV